MLFFMIANGLCLGSIMLLRRPWVDRGFESRSDQNKDYKVGMCCLSAKHTSLRRTSNDWFVRNQDNVSEWCDMSIRGLLLQ
jgi:hypothetical protein